MYLSPAPLYHSAPLFYCMSTMRLGGTAIVDGAVRSRDSARADREVPRHAQPVGADDVRAHAEAARRRARQVRPVVAEGRDPRGGAVLGRGEAQDDRVVGPDHRRVLRRDRRHGRDLHQLAPTGSRTRARSASRCSRPIHILDDDGNELPPGEVGTVWFEPPPNRPGFEYHKDEAKTRDSFNAAGLVDRRRHGLPRRRRLPLPHRPAHVHDRVGRREHLSAGSGEPAHRPPEGLRRRGVRHPRSGDGRAGARVVQPTELGRRRTRARTRAARVLPASTSRTTSARRRSTSIASCRASRPASSTSGCCATATGATRRRASSEPGDGNRARTAARERARRRHLRVRSGSRAAPDAATAASIEARGAHASRTSPEHGYPGAARSTRCAPAAPRS